MRAGQGALPRLSCLVLGLPPPPPPQGSAGLSFGANEHKMGWRAQPTAAVNLDKVGSCPPGNRRAHFQLCPAHACTLAPPVARFSATQTDLMRARASSHAGVCAQRADAGQARGGLQDCHVGAGWRPRQHWRLQHRRRGWEGEGQAAAQQHLAGTGREEAGAVRLRTVDCVAVVSGALWVPEPPPPLPRAAPCPSPFDPLPAPAWPPAAAFALDYAWTYTGERKQFATRVRDMQVCQARGSPGSSAHTGLGQAARRMHM